jgi:hypothetical protein
VDQLDCGLLILRASEVMAAGTESRNLNVCLTESPKGDTAASFHRFQMRCLPDPMRMDGRVVGQLSSRPVANVIQANAKHSEELLAADVLTKIVTNYDSERA